MALTLSIGNGPIALVQVGTVIETDLFTTGSFNLILPVASTAGTTLIAIAASSTPSAGMVVNSFPAGWIKLAAAAETTNSRLEVWAYLNNPGGISSVAASASAVPGPGAIWWTNLSEWSNVLSLSALEASGTATATSGTTLAPTTTGNVLTSGDVAISAWIQRLAGSSTVTFTTPASWTRLVDNGSSSFAQHLDAEYLLNPTTGATLGPTLTSTGTTSSSASGAIVVLKAAPPMADQSAYIEYGSIAVKLNTLDFALIDCPVPIQNSSTVTLSSPGDFPDWSGTVARVEAADLVDLQTGHSLQRITATNSAMLNFTSAPFDLTDNPVANVDDIWQLENGDLFELENGSGNWLLEDSIEQAGYAGLSIITQNGSTAPATLTTIGTLRCYQAGLWPGMTFKLTSSNLAKWILAPGNLYTVQTITVTYQGAGPPSPVYDIQFGDRIQTLAEWTKAHAV